MKKHIMSLLKVFSPVVGVLLLATCLGPIGIDPNIPPININIPGGINTTDVTSAVLLLTNRSKTVDVTNVTITQPEWTAPADNPYAQPPNISFTNKPKRLEKKAQYLTPSDKSYQVVIDYKYDARDDMPGGTGRQTLTVPVPLPRQIVEMIIYRGVNGVVVIDRDAIDPDPHDIGEPLQDPLPGEGSSPAVIPPENRNKMATFIVVSKTSSMIIDSVSFKMGEASYTMGRVGANDKQSIALRQGGWETRLQFTRQGTTKTLGPVNSIIVPSNDPQAIREHYLYFYLNNRGDYAISQTWPPFPNDVEEEDMLPPDIGYGRGLIKIINNSYAMAKIVTIHNLKDTDRFPLTIDYDKFTPSIPVQYNKTGYVDVIGTENFPIEAHDGYLVQVTMESIDGFGIIERKAYIKDQVITITIAPDDLQIMKAQGAKVTMENRTSSWPVEIVGLTVRNKTNSYQASYFGSSTWNPKGSIGENHDAVQYVMSNTAMPITESAQFEAMVTLYGNGVAETITKEIDPAILYSELPPDQNQRTITVTDSDVPETIIDAFVNNRGALVTLSNEIVSWPVEIIAMKVQNKADADQNTSYNTNTWEPKGSIGIGKKSSQRVTNSTVMPITEGTEFEALILLQCSGTTATITREFDPAELYSTKSLEQNTRTITITDSDVPDSLKDAYTYTRGVKVTLENKVASWPVEIIGMTVRNKANNAENSSYSLTTWEPHIQIGKNQSAVQRVMSSVAMPIMPNVQFDARITLYGSGKTETITKSFSPAVLYSELPPDQNPRTITITDSDVPDSIKDAYTYTRGATVTLRNNVASWPVEIIGMVVRNKANTAENSSYGISTWVPQGAIDETQSAVQLVMSSPAMPIKPSVQFEARITLSGNNKTAVITKAFSPAVLYSESTPAQNTRTIIITDTDVPDGIKVIDPPDPDAVGAVVTLRNNVSTWPVQITGMTVRNTANHAQSSYYGTTSWTPLGMINKSGSAVQKVLSSAAMPITAGAEFEAVITISGSGETATITKAFSPATLYSTTPDTNTRTITISDSDVPDVIKDAYTYTRGATVTLQNNVTSWPVQIVGMTVRNKANNAQNSYYSTASWTPLGVIDKSRSAVQLVMSSPAMPIRSGVEFEAVITISGSGATATVTKAFNPAVLYSDNTPAQNTRTITITNADVPDSIIDAYINSRGATVVLVNNVSAKWPVQITNMQILNKANHNQAASYSYNTWLPAGQISNGRSATQGVVATAPAMPLAPNVEFEARIFLFGNGQADYIYKTFNPAVLYSDLPYDQNIRTLTITDADVPEALRTPDQKPPTPEEEKQKEIADAEDGDIINIDGNEWIKVRSDSNGNVLLMLNGVIPGGLTAMSTYLYHPNVNHMVYPKAEIRTSVDNWYMNLQSPILKKIALNPVIPDPVASDLAHTGQSGASSAGTLAGPSASQLVVFLPRYADIINLKNVRNRLANYTTYWLIDFIVPAGWDNDQPHMGIIKPDGSLYHREAANVASARPVIWVATK